MHVSIMKAKNSKTTIVSAMYKIHYNLVTDYLENIRVFFLTRSLESTKLEIIIQYLHFSVFLLAIYYFTFQ